MRPASKQHERDGEAGEPLIDLNLSLSHEGKAKAFDDGHDGIQRHEPLKVLRHH